MSFPTPHLLSIFLHPCSPYPLYPSNPYLNVSLCLSTLHFPSLSDLPLFFYAPWVHSSIPTTPFSPGLYFPHPIRPASPFVPAQAALPYLSSAPLRPWCSSYVNWVQLSLFQRLRQQSPPASCKSPPAALIMYTSAHTALVNTYIHTCTHTYVQGYSFIFFFPLPVLYVSHIHVGFYLD